MIVVKIEMWPGGYEDQKYPLGTLVIVNDGTSTDPHRGNYDVWKLYASERIKSFRDKQPWTRVDNWPRHSYTVWKLVKRCLENL